MRLGEHQVEERRVYIDLVPGTDDSYIVRPLPLEGERVRKMRLFDPGAVVCDSFSLEAAELESNVRLVLDDHV